VPEISLETTDGVALVTIENAEVRNALNPDLAGQLVAICDRIDDDPDIGATVVRGAGGTFCSGADTRDWDGDVLSDEGYERIDAIYRSFLRFGRLQTPTIAAVRGAAVGAGLNLALAADLRIVATDSKLLAGFLRIGIHPGGGFFTLAGRSGGRESAAALGLFGEALSGEDAVAHGLAWEALPDEGVEPRALELAGRVASDPLLARRASASLRRELGPPPTSWEAAAEMERGVQMWTMARYANRRAQQDSSD
jgi:enoyl-CoA hydratase